MIPSESPGGLSVTTRFVLGVGGGIVFSVLFYFAVAASETTNVPLFLGAVAVKLVAGIGLCFSRYWRPFGAGLLASMPIGVMIFVMLCFGAIIVFAQP